MVSGAKADAQEAAFRELSLTAEQDPALHLVLSQMPLYDLWLTLLQDPQLRANADWSIVPGTASLGGEEATPWQPALLATANNSAKGSIVALAVCTDEHFGYGPAAATQCVDPDRWEFRPLAGGFPTTATPVQPESTHPKPIRAEVSTLERTITTALAHYARAHPLNDQMRRWHIDDYGPLADFESLARSTLTDRPTSLSVAQPCTQLLPCFVHDIDDSLSANPRFEVQSVRRTAGSVLLTPTIIAVTYRTEAGVVVRTYPLGHRDEFITTSIVAETGRRLPGHYLPGELMDDARGALAITLPEGLPPARRDEFVRAIQQQTSVFAPGVAPTPVEPPPEPTSAFATEAPASAMVCPQCGNVAHDERKFCGQCGAYLTQSAPQPDAPADDQAEDSAAFRMSSPGFDASGDSNLGTGGVPPQVGLFVLSAWFGAAVYGFFGVLLLTPGIQLLGEPSLLGLLLALVVLMTGSTALAIGALFAWIGLAVLRRDPVARWLGAAAGGVLLASLTVLLIRDGGLTGYSQILTLAMVGASLGLLVFGAFSPQVRGYAAPWSAEGPPSALVVAAALSQWISFLFAINGVALVAAYVAYTASAISEVQLLLVGLALLVGAAVTFWASKRVLVASQTARIGLTAAAVSAALAYLWFGDDTASFFGWIQASLAATAITLLWSPTTSTYFRSNAPTPVKVPIAHGKAFCPNCGSATVPAAAFCANCGTALGNAR